MWFATWDGLYKFDGYTFKNYKAHPGDSIGLSNNRLDNIKEDKYVEVTPKAMRMRKVILDEIERKRANKS